MITIQHERGTIYLQPERATVAHMRTLRDYVGETGADPEEVIQYSVLWYLDNLGQLDANLSIAEITKKALEMVEKFEIARDKG